MSIDAQPGLKFGRQKFLVIILLVLVLALGAFFRFYRLGAQGVGNTYYAATVKSMLGSWHNFFFASFEPGGSVSVDKPPLGFWIQALSAYFLGVNGFALALPNAVAGVLSILVLYKLIRRPFGPWAGLAAALALALMPAATSAERNNTIDGLLVFVLLLAAWAFLQSVYIGRLRWLFLGAFLVGLGFNIKMLQAFLPLPAFYALYFFAARHGWGKKILHLLAATLLLLVVSLSWAAAVDLTPAEDRPYVGSSTGNRVMELIVGHNGLERITNLFGGRRPQQGGLPPAGNLPLVRPGNVPKGGYPPYGGLPVLPPANQPGQPDQPGPYVSSASRGIMDVGVPGTLRLFTEPLAGEASWLLPFVLAGLFVVGVALWRGAVGERSAALILWTGWLLPEAVYFTYSQGIMHAYYMIMMGPPIAALFAMTGWAFWQLIQRHRLLGWGLMAFFTAGTLVFQMVTLWGRTSFAGWAVGVAAVLFVVGLILVVMGEARLRTFASVRGRLASAGLLILLAALLVAPLLWSALTTFNSNPNAALPYSGPSSEDGPGMINTNASVRLLEYLLANTAPDSYLVAVMNANLAAPLILATGRPVLTFGGFSGTDPVMDADGLAEMVSAGELRFVLDQGLEQRPGILEWLKQNCHVVDAPGLMAVYSQPGPPGGLQPGHLLDCGK